MHCTSSSNASVMRLQGLDYQATNWSCLPSLSSRQRLVIIRAAPLCIWYQRPHLDKRPQSHGQDYGLENTCNVDLVHNSVCTEVRNTSMLGQSRKTSQNKTLQSRHFAVVVVTAWVVGGAVVLEVGGTGDIVVVSGNSFVVSDNSFVDSGNSVGSDSLVLVCDNSGTTLVVSTNPVVEFSGNSWLVEVSGGGVVVGASVDVTVVVVKRSHSSHDLGQCRHMYAEFSLHAPLRAQTAQKLCSSAHGPPSTSCNRSRATKQRLILPLAFVLN